MLNGRGLPLKHGDIVMAPNGLIGRLFVDQDTKECEVRSLDDKAGNWVVRSWSVKDLTKGGWRKYYTQNWQGN